MTRFARSIRFAVGMFALTLALLVGGGGHLGIQGVGATISEGTDAGGWTPGNFASSCIAAGGHLIEIDSPGIKYSKCVFPGGTNKCDWIKKICTFGIVADQRILHANSVNGTLTTTGPGASATTTNRAPNGTVVERDGS
jgi:hypothetical protein